MPMQHIKGRAASEEKTKLQKPRLLSWPANKEGSTHVLWGKQTG